MQVGLSINFKADAVKGDFYNELFDRAVKFEPNRFNIRKYGKSTIVKDWNATKHRKLILAADFKDDFGVSRNSNIFTSRQTGSDNPHRSITIVQEKEHCQYTNDDIEYIINHDGFVSAYLFDDDYVMVQSAYYEGNIIRKGISLESIKNTPYTIQAYTGMKEYDISFNPGRQELIGYTWLIPAWKMWFGSGFYHLVTKEHLLSFPCAYKIEELNNDIIFIQLFENIEDSETKENQDKQWAWRKWLNFDALVKKHP